MTAELADYETAGCGYCLHHWHDNQPCQGEVFMGVEYGTEPCDCPSSEQP